MWIVMIKVSEKADVLGDILIPELGRWRQETCCKFELHREFQANQSYRARLYLKNQPLNENTGTVSEHSWIDSMAGRKQKRITSLDSRKKR